MLRELANEYGTVFVHMDSAEREKDFMKQAEAEGFLFGDGAKPSMKNPSDLLSLHADQTISYVGTVGRIGYQCHGVKSVEYAQLQNAHEN